MMRKWLVAAVLAVLAMVGAWGINHHYHHYGRQHAQATRTDMYVGGDVYNAASDMHALPSDMY